MRIHLVSEHADPLALLGDVDAGGQNVHVGALAHALATRGHQVVVHTRRNDPTLPRRLHLDDGVIVDHVDAGPAEPLPKDQLLAYMGAFADDLARQWRHQPPDVVHAHFWMSGLASLAAAAPLGVPTLLTFHALGAEKRRHQGGGDSSPASRIDYERYLARTVDGVIATSAAELRQLVAMGAPPSRVWVVPCGVDLEHFRPDGPAWAPSAYRHRVVCVSRLVPRKGLAELISAVAALPEVELLIAGGPPQAMLADDRAATMLSDLAQSLGAGERIRLLGAVEHREIPALMRSATLVACPSWYEPFGMTAVEAMACGVPVVATGVGGLAETILDGRTGVLVPPRQPAALQMAIEELLANTTRRSAMQASARRRSTRYGWDEVATRTLAVVASVRGNATPSVAATSARSPSAPNQTTGVTPDWLSTHD